jgi:prophage maintenance system killer protein
LSEILTSKDIEDILSYNRSVAKPCGIDCKDYNEILDRIIGRMFYYDSIQDKRQRIIKKASHILVTMTYYQPFCDCNRRTALNTALSYLQRNGLMSAKDIPSDIVDGIYSLLASLKERGREIKAEMGITNIPLDIVDGIEKGNNK